MEQITLEARDFEKIRACGTVRHYKPDEVVFSEGDSADFVYFIESGLVSIFLYEFTNRVEIGQRGAGSFFGEMAAISGGKRTATVTAVGDATLVMLDKDQFVELMAADSEINEKVNRVIALRTEELALKENLLATTGIKGDPTMRESAFDRDRRDSPMDKVLPQMIPNIKTLLLERCVSEVFLQFNSGEIRLTSIFDPFNYEIHPANKLIDSYYLDRHFPVLDFSEKVGLIRSMYGTIAAGLDRFKLPERYKESYRNHYKTWEPLSPDEIVHVIDKLQVLRSIPNFYLRNMGVSITRDAIRMQFNCDGTHIVTTRDYDRFIADNLGLETVV